MRISFTGDLGFNGLETKLPWLREGKTKSGDDYQTINISVASAKNNRANVELFAMKQDVIKTMDAEGNKIDINWDDRLDDDVVEQVASYKKYVLKLGDERLEFISPWDFAEAIKEHKDELVNKTCLLSGDTSVNVYQGNVSNRFNLKGIYEVDEDSKKNLKISAEYYFCKDSFDTSDWSSEKKLYINGWTKEYINKDIGQKYVPLQLVFDCGKIDFDNEEHVKMVKFKLGILGCELVDGKIKCKLGKTVKSIDAVIGYVNGAELQEFDESMLSDTQREAISLGLKKLSDFQTGNVYGNRVTLYKLVNFGLKGKYEDGALDTEEKISEFEENVFVVEEEETVEEVVEKAAKKTEVEEDSDDDEDLFS